jgi:hypothetical protein
VAGPWKLVELYLHLTPRLKRWREISLHWEIHLHGIAIGKICSLRQNWQNFNNFNNKNDMFSNMIPCSLVLCV